MYSKTVLSLLFVINVTAVTFAQLPLMQISDLQYEGAFIIPAGDYGESTTNYSAGTFALSSDKQGFFLAGHNVHGAIAEFSIPDLIISDSLQDLQFATVRQGFRSMMDLTPDNNPQGIDRISGLQVVGDKLIVNAVEYYDAPANNTHTTFVVEDPDDLAGSVISGYYHIQGEAHLAGWISAIPLEWQNTLDGEYLAGNSSKYPINSRSPMGVSAFVFDPSDLVNNTSGVIPSTTLLDYDLDNPLYADYDSYANAHYNLVEVNGNTDPGHTFEDADAIVGNNILWTSESQASFGFIVPGTRTYMSIGSSGGHNSGIGYKATQNNGNLCGGPCPYDADDVYNYYWLWDLDDLLDVKNGTIEPYEVRPYDSGELTVPLQYDDYYSAPEFHPIIGGDFDPVSGILYLTLYDGGASGSPYSTNPAVVAYRIESGGTTLEPVLGLELMHSGFTQPTKITSAGDESKRIFVTEKTGKIKIIDSLGTVLSSPFLDISNIISTNSERGLLGMAFHPNYDENRYFYLSYTSTDGSSTIARYETSTADPNIADGSSGEVILQFDQPFANHNGGDINFGPDDGYLYIASGDGGSGNDPACVAQDITSPLGKLLRIDVDVPAGDTDSYLIPSDNPFFGDTATEQSIWAYGLRNPWRFSFDRENGDMWLADVGQNMIEEVDYDMAPLTGGINYGWKFMEGTLCLTTNTTDPDCGIDTPPCGSADYTAPLFEYTHDFTTGGSSITGGYVYRGCKYTHLQGLYICADFSSGNFWTVDNFGSNEIHSFLQTSVTTFGEDESGELYCATIQGNIYKVIDTAIPAVLTLTAADTPLQGTYEAYEKIVIDENVTIATDVFVTLIAPEVIIKDQVLTENSGNLIIKNNGCD